MEPAAPELNRGPRAVAAAWVWVTDSVCAAVTATNLPAPVASPSHSAMAR